MSRNFANKIWNAARFSLMNLQDYRSAPLDTAQLTAPDRWILSRSQKLVGEVTRALDSYEFGDASRRLYDFFWSEFCDWYLELVKPRLYGENVDPDRRTAQAVLVKVLDTSLRLLHPFMPFITEEIWQKLPNAGESLMIADWPIADPSLIDSPAEEELAVVQGVVTAVRAVRSELKVAPGSRIKATVTAANERLLGPPTSSRPLIERLAGLSGLEIGPNITRPKQAAVAAVGDIEVFIPLAGMVDISQETERLHKEQAVVTRERVKLEQKLSNADFLAKAPVEVVQKEKDKEALLIERLSKIEAQLTALTES